jgi:hypothetical protein
MCGACAGIRALSATGDPTILCSNSRHENDIEPWGHAVAAMERNRIEKRYNERYHCQDRYGISGAQDRREATWSEAELQHGNVTHGDMSSFSMISSSYTLVEFAF